MKEDDAQEHLAQGQMAALGRVLYFSCFIVILWLMSGPTATLLAPPNVPSVWV